MSSTLQWHTRHINPYSLVVFHLKCFALWILCCNWCLWKLGRHVSFPLLFCFSYSPSPYFLRNHKCPGSIPIVFLPHSCCGSRSMWLLFFSSSHFSVDISFLEGPFLILDRVLGMMDVWQSLFLLCPCGNCFYLSELYIAALVSACEIGILFWIGIGFYSLKVRGHAISDLFCFEFPQRFVYPSLVFGLSWKLLVVI